MARGRQPYPKHRCRSIVAIKAANWHQKTCFRSPKLCVGFAFLRFLLGTLVWKLLRLRYNLDYCENASLLMVSSSFFAILAFHYHHCAYCYDCYVSLYSYATICKLPGQGATLGRNQQALKPDILKPRRGAFYMRVLPTRGVFFWVSIEVPGPCSLGSGSTHNLGQPLRCCCLWGFCHDDVGLPQLQNQPNQEYQAACLKPEQHLKPYDQDAVNLNPKP